MRYNLQEKDGALFHVSIKMNSFRPNFNPYFYIRPDPQTQSLVYKLVPALYSKEMQRKEDFYRSTGMRASSSCSDDSVLGEQINEHDYWVNFLFI